MPISIPSFAQYQAPLPPLRGLWNRTPVEGDRFVSAEIDWLTTTGGNNAVQFSLSGNSPVALSQIVALFIDNSRSGADVDFLFPDTGFLLTVPAHVQGLFPVLTNALTFYAIASSPVAGDLTVLQALNSLPPPIPLIPSASQNHAGVANITLGTNATTAIVPAGITGTLNNGSINVVLNNGASIAQAQIDLIDGAGHVLWSTIVVAGASQQQNLTYSLAGLAVRFQNGLSVRVSGTTFSGNNSVVTASVYYSTP